MELGDAETVFGAPHHPYTEALLSAVPQVEGERARAHPARGRDPQPRPTRRRAACSTPAARATSATSATSRSRELKEVEPGHFWRCHYLGRGAARAAADGAARRGPRAEERAREDPRRGPRAGRRAAARSTELELAPPGPGEVLVRLHASGVCHSDSTRSTARPRRAARRCSATRAPGVVEARGRGRRRSPRARAWCCRGCRPAGAATSACATCAHLCTHGVGGDGTGGLLDGTPRLSRDGEPVYHYSFLSSFAERDRRAGALLHPDPARRAVRRSPRSSAARSRPAPARSGGPRACGPGERVCVFGCGGVGHERGARRASRSAPTRSSPSTSTEEKLEPALALGATHAVALGGRRRGRPPSACARSRGGGVDYAFEATGRPEAALAAFLSTRARGAAVLIGIPAADAVLTLPALPIPRMERRVLGSIYGSSRPERDFPALLDALPARAAAARPAGVARGCRSRRCEEAFDRMRGGAALRVVLDLEEARDDGSAGRPDRRGLVGRGAERQPHQRRARAARLAHRRGRRGRAGRPAARARAVPRLPVAGARRAPGRRSSSTSRPIDGGRSARSPGARRSSAIAQGVLDAVADGLVDPAEAAEVIVLVAVWVDPGRARRDRGQAGEPRGDARRDRRRAAAAGRGARARARRAPRGGGEHLLRRRLTCASPRSRSGATASPLDPPFHAAWDPVPRTRSEATLVIVRADDGDGGLRERRRAARRRAARAPARRPRSAPDRGRARAVRDRRPPRRPAVDRRGRGLGPRRARARRAAVAAARRPLGADPRVRVERRARRAGGARAARRRRCATPACAPSSSASTTPTGARTSRWSRRCATPSASDVELMVDANHGWRMAGDRAPRWDVADRDPVRPRARAARRLLARGAAADRTTSRATRACAPAPRCGSRRARWCAACTRRATSCCAAASTSCSPTSSSPAASAAAAGSPALADLCGRDVLAAHVVERPRAAREPAPGARRLDVPLPRGSATTRRAGAPERRDWLLGGPLSRSRADGTIAPPPGPGLGVTPDLDALEAHRVA